MAHWRLAALGIAAIVLTLVLATLGRPSSNGVAAVPTGGASGSVSRKTSAPPVLATVRPTISATVPPIVPSTPGPPGTLRHLTVTMPAGWTVTSGTTTLRVAETGGGLFQIEMVVTALAPGATMTIRRPAVEGQNVNMRANFSIGGDSLKELVASITAGLDDGSEPQKATVGGARGYTWYVPQTSYIGPLAALAVVEWKDTFYVFTQHLPLDGAGGDLFRLFLHGAAFR